MTIQLSLGERNVPLSVKTGSCEEKAICAETFIKTLDVYFWILALPILVFVLQKSHLLMVRKGS